MSGRDRPDIGPSHDGHPITRRELAWIITAAAGFVVLGWLALIVWLTQ